MRFEDALPVLKVGKKIRRKNRNKINYIRTGEEDLIVDENDECFPFILEDFLADNWEIVKEAKKVKLRDMCGVQFEEWEKKNCAKLAEDYCDNCPFQKVKCYNDNKVNDVWYLNKDLYSDKFLDQEIEIEEE